MVDALGGHTAAQNTLGAEGLRDGDALSSTTLSNLLQGLRGNGIVRLQDTAYGSTRNAVNNQPGAVTRASTHTLTVQGGYAVLDGVLYEFAGGPGGTATVTIGSHGTGTALAASGEQSMYVVYVASQGGQAKIHVDGGSPVQTSTGLYPQVPTQFLVDYDTGGSILNDQVVALATLRCSYNAGGGTHKVDVQEVNDKRIFTRSNPIYMTPLSSGTIVTDGSELSQISRGAAEGINTAAQLNALFSGNEAGVLGNNANGSTKIDVGALWMSTGRSGTSLGYGPGDGVDRSSNRMNDDLFFAGQNNNETGVITKRLFTEGVAAPTGTLSTASYTISSHGDKWFIFAPANGATITLNPEKSGSTYLFPEGHVIEVCNSAAANGGNIVFDSTGLNTTLLPDQRATFIFEGSTWLRCDYQAAISTMAFTTLTDTPSSLGSAGQHIRVNSGGTAFEFIDSPTLTTEEVQDVVGGMFSGNTETNITATYQDSDGTIDLVVAEQRTDAQVKDLAGALFTGNTETFITATYQTSDDTVDLVVPVHDEDDLSSNSATHLATQQSIKAYVDAQVAGVIDSAPGALDTLNELAAAINDDASFHTTVTTALSNRVRVDTASQGLTTTQKSNARTNMGLGTLSTLSAVDISDNTNLSASSPLSLTGDTLSIANIPFGSLHADAYQTSSESFANNDTSLMTSAAIEDKILSYGYSTTTGTVTSVATGTGLTGGSITSSGTISLSHLGLENLSDPNADRILFWDDSAGVLKFLTAGSNLAFSGTTLNATNTNQLTTFTIRDDDDDSKTIEQGKFIKFVSATGTAGTNWSGAGTTGDPFVMTITSPDTQLSQAQVRDFAGGMFTGNTETFITATYQTSDDTVDLVVPVLDEDNMASNSATHLATQQSIKAYVDTEVSGLIDSAPGTLDTLNELAAAINDDASFHTTMTTALGNRLRVDTASQGLTGTQQSNARTNLGLGSMALLSSIDISDNTNLAVGTGLDLSGDTISVDVSDFMTNGSDNRVVTATGTDAMNAEANLTWDGTSFGIGTSSPLSKVHIEKTAHDFDSSPQDGDFHLFLKATESSTAGDAVSIGFAQTSDGTTVGAKISHLVSNSFSRGHLVFSTNNTDSAGDTTEERMRITDAGDVGIGNQATAGYKLDVQSGTTDTIARFKSSDANGRIIIQDNDDTIYLGTTSGYAYLGGTQNLGAGANLVVHKTSGNVGIGTTGPEYKLDVTGSLRILPTISSHAGTAIRIGPQDNDIDVTLLRVDGNGGGAGTGNSGESNDSNYGYSIKYMGSGSGVNNRYALFMDNQAGTAFEAMTVLQDGKVGISDSTPSYKLDVAGDINLTGDLRQNGNIITTYNLYDNEITLTAGTGLTGGGAFTLNQNSDETLTFNVAGLTVSELAANSLQTSSESFADNDTSLMTSAAIQDKIESYGYSTTTGDITNVSAGVGLSGGGGSGSVTLTLDMSELPDMTQAVTSSEDELIILDNGADKRKLISEIPLSAFNNDSGFGAVSAVANGADNRIATFSSATALNGESALTFDGTTMSIRTATDHPLVIENTTNAGYAGIQFSDNSSGSYAQKGEFRFNHADGSSEGSGASFHFTTTESDLSIVGGKFISAVGSASEPGFSFSGDTNVGMFRPATNELAFSVVNEAMRIDSNGKVGIGTTSPAHNLDVASNSNPTIFIRNTDAAHAADDKIGSLLFFNAEDSTGGEGSRVGAGLRYVATDAYGRGKLELTAGTSNPISSYGDAENYTDNSITRLSINGSTGAITFNSAYTFPTSDGSANQVLQTDGNGALSFAAASGGSVSAVANGSNNRIATFSSADALNGEANLTFDGTILNLVGNQTIDHDSTNPDSDGDFGIKIDHDSSGSTSVTGDREQGGLYVDADTSATGGDQSNEHRLYGVWSDTRVNSSADPDAVYAVYGYSEDQRSGTSGMTAITNLAGGWFIGAGDANNSAPTISTLYGVYGSANIQDTGTISNSHAVKGLTTISANRAANINNLRGVSSEIDIGGTRTGGDITINWARVFEAVLDHNATDASGDTAVVTDGYLYYGDYAVSQSDQITNKWGLYINDEDKNYISGNLGIGTTAPDAPLHVEHSSGLIAKMGEGNVETRMQFADARAMIGYHGDHAVIQGGAGGKGVSINVNDGTFGSGVAIRAKSDGKVGINTTTPENRFQVNHTGADGDDGIMVVRADTSTAYQDLLGGIGFDSVDGNDPSSVLQSSAAIVARAREDHSATDKGGYLEFMYSPTDQDDDTTSSVGMTMMDGKLAVNNGGLHPLTSLTVYHSAGDFNDGMLVVRNDTSTASGDLLGAIGFDSKDGNAPSQATEASAGIAAYAAEDHSTGDKGGHLAFFTSPIDQDDDTAAIERMRVTSEGLVGIGETTPVFASGGGLHIQNSSQANLRLEDDSTEYFDVAMQNGDAYLINRVSDGFISLRTNSTERLKIASGGGITFNQAYTFPTSDGSANQVLQTNGNGALSFADQSSDTFVIFGEEGDLYAGTGSTGNANGYQFSYGNGRANVQQTSSGTDFGINVPVDCTLTRVDVVFGNNGNVSSGTTTFVVVKNGTNQSGNLSTTHTSGVHDTHHTGLSHSFSAGDRFNLRTTTTSKQVGPMRMTAYFTPT